jgi:hypothetical protein
MRLHDSPGMVRCKPCRAVELDYRISLAGPQRMLLQCRPEAAPPKGILQQIHVPGMLALDALCYVKQICDIEGKDINHH